MICFVVIHCWGGHQSFQHFKYTFALKCYEIAETFWNSLESCYNGVIIDLA
jgi:hypothetical protein